MSEDIVIKLSKNFSRSSSIEEDINNSKVKYEFELVKFLEAFIYNNLENIIESIGNISEANESRLSINEWLFGYKINKDSFRHYEMTDSLKSYMNSDKWTPFKQRILDKIEDSFYKALNMSDLLCFKTIVGPSKTEKNREARYDKLVNGYQNIRIKFISGLYNEVTKIYLVLNNHSYYKLCNISNTNKYEFNTELVSNRIEILSKDNYSNEIYVDGKKCIFYIPILFCKIRDNAKTIYVKGSLFDLIKFRNKTIFKK